MDLSGGRGKRQRDTQRHTKTHKHTHTVRVNNLTYK